MSRDGWEEVTLAELGTTQTGSTPKKANKDHYGSHIPFVKPADFLADGRLQLGKDGLSKIGLESAREIPPFSVLMVCIGATIGKAGFNEVPITTNQQINAFIPGNRVHHKFVYYTFISKAFQRAVNHGSGQATLPIINKTKWSAIKIAVPPKAEQKRIVSILDEAFSAIAKAKENAEKNLLSARELFESYLNRVFTQQGPGWQEKPLELVCKFSSGGTPSKKNDKFWGGDIPWVSGRDMKSTRLSDTTLHITKIALEESSSAKLANVGDLLILVRGMGLAHGAQVGELTVPATFNQDIRALKANEELVPRYLLFALRTRINLSENVLSSAAHGTLKINSDELKAVGIPFPSLSEQQRIVGIINGLAESTRKLETIQTQKLANLDELKQSLLQKAFTGQLTARELAST